MRIHCLVAAACTVCYSIALADPPNISKAVAPSGRCVEYDDASVTLSGIVFYRAYYGSPGYGENPGEDSLDYAQLLLLDAPACVFEKDGPGEQPFEDNVLTIHLAPIHVKPTVIVKAYAKHVTVRGSLFHAHTAHHRTRVMMDVYEVSVS